MMAFIKQNATIIIMACGLVITIASTLSVFAAYYSSVQDQTQKDQIQRLGEISNNLGETNVELGYKIKDLQEVNLQVTNRIENLTVNSNLLIEEVNKLSAQTKQIIESMDIKADKEYAKNTSAGELELNFKSIGNQKLVFMLGGGTMDDASVQIGNERPFNIGIQNDKLLINTKVYDINDNLIAEIENNKWRLNKNYAGKFNYDKTGFEVIDNKGNIAMSVDVLASNMVAIQGIFPIKSALRIFIAGSQGVTSVPYSNSAVDKKILQTTGKKYDDFFNERVSDVKMKQLFEYTGKDYLGRRKKY
ncbi:hypothetical protein [Ferruginibacter sp.]|nr:hypothetical protein [Ferruginibacter sp.]